MSAISLTSPNLGQLALNQSLKYSEHDVEIEAKALGFIKVGVNCSILQFGSL
jgi:hypothetical protein